MKIKMNDIVKIIGEELEAVRTAIPAWLNEEEEAQFEAGSRIKDQRTDREGTVISLMAGPDGGGAIVKMDDGKEEKIRMKFLQAAGSVSEDSAVQEGANDLGWTPDELMGFLEKKVQAVAGSGPGTGGVTAKEMAYAFGGQWQSHQAEMQKMVAQGQLAMQGNKFVRAAEGSPAETVSEGEYDDELADYYDEFPELRQDPEDAGDAPAHVAAQMADEFGSEEEEEDDVSEYKAPEKVADKGEWMKRFQLAAGNPQPVPEDFWAYAARKFKYGINPEVAGNEYNEQGSPSQAAAGDSGLSEADEGGEGVHDIFNMPPSKAVKPSGNSKEDALRQIVADGQMAAIEGTKMDTFTASAILQVLDGLSRANKEKYLAVPIVGMANIAMSMLKKLSESGANLLKKEYQLEEEEETEDEIYERLRAKAMSALAEGPEVYQSAGDVPQELVDGVVSFLKDQRSAGIGELDLGSIMQDMGQEIDTIKLILVDRLGYEIVDSETDPRGKVNFDQGVVTMNETGIERELKGQDLEDFTNLDPMDQSSSQAQGMAGAFEAGKRDAEMGREQDPSYTELGTMETAAYAEGYKTGLASVQESTNKLREHVGRFMKVTLREEARR